MMAWITFTAKILLAMLSPALLAFALVKGWSALYPDAGMYPQGDAWSEQTFGMLILGLLLLSVILPVLLTVRDIQNQRSPAESQ